MPPTSSSTIPTQKSACSTEDDFRQGYVLGLKDVLGDRYGKMVVSEISYEISMPTVDSQVVAIKTSNRTSSSTSARRNSRRKQSKKLAELDWHPVPHHDQRLGLGRRGAQAPPVSTIPGASSAPAIRWTSPIRNGTLIPGMQKYRAFMAKYYPEADRSESGPLRPTTLNRAGRGAEALRHNLTARTS